LGALLVHPAAVERPHQVRQALPLDADFRRQDVVPNRNRDRLYVDAPFVDESRQLAPELSHVHYHEFASGVLAAAPLARVLRGGLEVALEAHADVRLAVLVFGDGHGLQENVHE
jgi:hypothetical protein